MNKKQNILDNKTFEQSGLNLIQKVREAEKISQHEVLSSWQEIELHLEKSRFIFGFPIRRILFIAASIVILFSIGLHLWIGTQKDNSSLPLALLEMPISVLSDNEIVLIENREKLQLKDESAIRYNSQGESNVEEHVVKKETTVVEDKQKEEVNQIIVPKGRRANITFSDGTRIYVNSGSRVVYPSVFKKEIREILVEGEIYLAVKKDPSRPFIVKTKGLDVKVLGTEFNVCAYKDDASTSVVLVNGSVEVRTTKNEKLQLSPSQRIEINDKGSNIKEVDVFEYICWKDNMMFLNDRMLGDTLDRLSRYYGRSILYNEEIGNIPVSGKLDLREDIEDVINILCQSLFLQYKMDANNNIIISK